MFKNLTKADKEFLRAHYRGKVWDIAGGLLAYGVRGDDFDFIMRGGEDVNTDSHKQRLEWIEGAVKRMDERLSPELRRAMREGSACCLGGARDELARKIHDENATLGERFAALSEARLIIGGRAEQISDDTYRISFYWDLPEGAKCSCLKRNPAQPMSETWCMCCGGHIKHHFETAMGVRADVQQVGTLLTSAGAFPCTFELKVLEVLG